MFLYLAIIADDVREFHDMADAMFGFCQDDMYDTEQIGKWL